MIFLGSSDILLAPPHSRSIGATCHFTTFRHLQFRSRCRFCTSKSFRPLEKWSRKGSSSLLSGPSLSGWYPETWRNHIRHMDVGGGKWRKRERGWSSIWRGITMRCPYFVTKIRVLTWNKEKMTSQFTGTTIAVTVQRGNGLGKGNSKQIHGYILSDQRWNNNNNNKNTVYLWYRLVLGVHWNKVV